MTGNFIRRKQTIYRFSSHTDVSYIPLIILIIKISLWHV